MVVVFININIQSKMMNTTTMIPCAHLVEGKDHFTVVCSVTWPLNGSEAGDDLALVQSSPLFSSKCTQIALEQLDLHNKSSEYCIETSSPPASLPFTGQITEQTTVKWSIAGFQCHAIQNKNQNCSTDEVQNLRKERR